MRVLVACESSGVVRRAFENKGHDVMSCDLLPSDDDSPYHYQGDVFEFLEQAGKFDLMIAHPPCTYLCSSGMHHTSLGKRPRSLTDDALNFVARLMAADVFSIAIENPIGVISTHIRKPDQIIQPYQFGHDASKATCLWLKNLPRLHPTNMVAPRMVQGRRRWANQTDSGQNRLAPSADRWKQRSKTYDGIALAMAEQWNF